ncbi:VOC family protein [Brevundimonas sp.]|uniref:VOC family protein n=1 Tax=Brevundimonas sp. TaxID=1871086 RepID=UPI0026189F4D|nr:VOC family protein [Brevundimonas sp.]
MKIVTSLSFAGNCREAFEFYARVLGGEITAAMPYGDAPPEMPMPVEMKDWLMHCWLQVGDQALMGSDMHSDWATHINEPKNGFDVTFHTDSYEEGQRIFDALSEGGTVVMAFGETFWSPGYGNFTDRFGIPWMINVVPSADWAPAHLRGAA